MFITAKIAYIFISKTAAHKYDIYTLKVVEVYMVTKIQDLFSLSGVLSAGTGAEEQINETYLNENIMGVNP